MHRRVISHTLTIVTSNEDQNSSRHTHKSFKHPEANLYNQDQPNDSVVVLDVEADLSHNTKEKRHSSQSDE